MPATAKSSPVIHGSSVPILRYPRTFLGRTCKTVLFPWYKKSVFNLAKRSDSRIFLIFSILSQIFFPVNQIFRKNSRIFPGIPGIFSRNCRIPRKKAENFSVRDSSSDSSADFPTGSSANAFVSFSGSFCWSFWVWNDHSIELSIPASILATDVWVITVCQKCQLCALSCHLLVVFCYWEVKRGLPLALFCIWLCTCAFRALLCRLIFPYRAGPLKTGPRLSH